jgi:hypothetical protein
MRGLQKYSTLAISRRRFVGGAAVLAGAGGALLTDLAAGPAAAGTKLSQKAAGYRNKPMGKTQCDNCAVWQSPASCKLVDGPLSPSGWCNLYNAKS